MKLGQPPARETEARSLLATSRTTSSRPLTLWTPKKGTTFGCRSCRRVPISFSATCRPAAKGSKHNNTNRDVLRPHAHTHNAGVRPRRECEQHKFLGDSLCVRSVRAC